MSQETVTDREEERQQRGAEEEVEGADGSPLAAATREVVCTTDEELVCAIEGAENAATLKTVMIYGSAVTTDGVRKFAEGERELQGQEAMTRDFELKVSQCDWSEVQLVSLAGLALSKLTLDETKGVTSADVAAFAERARGSCRSRMR